MHGGLSNSGSWTSKSVVGPENLHLYKVPSDSLLVGLRTSLKNHYIGTNPRCSCFNLQLLACSPKLINYQLCYKYDVICFLYCHTALGYIPILLIFVNQSCQIQEREDIGHLVKFISQINITNFLVLISHAMSGIYLQ